MRRLISLMVVFMVCATCKPVEHQEIEVSELSMLLGTKTEQIHHFYGAGDFVANTDPIDCGEMKIHHSVRIKGGKLTVDGSTKDEIVFQINSCIYSKGKVFSDKGSVEVYNLSCNELTGIGQSPWTSVITIQKVTNGAKHKIIISIPEYANDGVMIKNTILKD